MKVKQVMTRNVCFVDQETPAMVAGALMLVRGIHRLPVVKDGKIIDIVCCEDIYRKILKKKLG